MEVEHEDAQESPVGVGLLVGDSPSPSPVEASSAAASTGAGAVETHISAKGPMDHFVRVMSPSEAADSTASAVAAESSIVSSSGRRPLSRRRRTKRTHTFFLHMRSLYPC
jgi:hypothetical protein